MTRHAQQTRERKFTFVLDDEEREMVKALGAADGRSAADWLRRMIRAQHAKLAKKGAKKTARKPR